MPFYKFFGWYNRLKSNYKSSEKKFVKRTRTVILLAITLPLFVLFQQCTKAPETEVTPVATRGYYLGFTTWPYTASLAGVDYPYEKIATDADLITYHIEGGVPWADAAADVLTDPMVSRYNSHITAEWAYKLSKKPAGHKLYVAVTPLNSSRSGIADSWTAAGNNITGVAPWNGYALDSTQVKQAYLNYCRRAITFFNPDFFAFGIELNLLETNMPAQMTNLLNLQSYIYQQLKILYPNLPVFVTLTGVDLLADYVGTATSAATFNTLLASSDYFALSTYPYLSGYLTTTLPADFFDRLAALSPKPKVIAEGGYLAETVTTTGPPSYTFTTDTVKQKAYVELLLAAADKHSFLFVNQWLVRDFDNSFGTSDFALIFQYIGMYDGAGNARPALTPWKNKLALPKQ